MKTLTDSELDIRTRAGQMVVRGWSVVIVRRGGQYRIECESSSPEFAHEFAAIAKKNGADSTTVIVPIENGTDLAISKA